MMTGFLGSTFDAAMALAPANEATADVLAYIQAGDNFTHLQREAREHDPEDLTEGFCAAVNQALDEGAIPGLDEKEAQRTVSWHHVAVLYRKLAAGSAGRKV